MAYTMVMHLQLMVGVDLIIVSKEVDEAGDDGL
jgi:hypothetical protein